MRFQVFLVKPRPLVAVAEKNDGVIHLLPRPMVAALHINSNLWHDCLQTADSGNVRIKTDGLRERIIAVPTENAAGRFIPNL